MASSKIMYDESYGLKVGDRVCYQQSENGIVARVGDSGRVFYVVYNCNNDWENYLDYTAQATYIKDLKKGWK